MVAGEGAADVREGREKRTRRLELRLDADLVSEERLLGLAELAKKHAGATPVAVSVVFPGEAEVIIAGTQLKVAPTDEMLAAVNKLFGTKVAELG